MFTHGVQSRRSLAPILLMTVFLTTACWEAVAQGSGSPAGEAGKAPQSRKAAVAKEAPEAKSAAAAEGKTENTQTQEIEMLKQLIAAQQQQIEQLRVAMEEQKQMIQQALNEKKGQEPLAPNLGEVASLNPALPPSVKAVEPPAELAPIAGSAPVTQDQMQTYTKKVDELDKSVGALNKGLAGFKLSGDLRLRSDNIFRSSNSVAGPQQNVRARYRLRLNVDKTIYDQADVHLQLGSGLFNNPLTYDSDYNGTVTRGPIFLTEVWGDFHPTKTFALRGGKMSEVFADNSRFLLDDDVRLNGFQEIAKTKSGKATIEFRAGQYIFTNPNVQILPTAAQCAAASPPANCAYVAAGYPAGRKVPNTNMFDQGIVVTAPSGDHWTHQFTFNSQLWRNPNSIQLASLSSGFPLLGNPYYGLTLSGGISGNGNGTTTKGGAIYTASDFQIGALTYRLDYKKWKSNRQAFPLSLEFHAAKNFGADFYNNALMGQISLGETKKGGDIGFRYGWFYKQANSMISQITDDDAGTGAGVNLKTHMLRFDVGISKFIAWQNILFIQSILAGDDPARQFFVNAQHGQAQQYRYQSQLQFTF